MFLHGTSQDIRVWQTWTVNIQGQTKQTYVQERKLISKDITWSCQTGAVFFISCLLLTPPYLLSAACIVHHSQASNVPFFKNYNICFFWWRLHKSESFISRQHTSSKTPGGFCYFYLIISWAYSGVRIHPGWQVLVPFESPIALFFQCFAMTPDW